MRIRIVDGKGWVNKRIEEVEIIFMTKFFRQSNDTELHQFLIGFKFPDF